MSAEQASTQRLAAMKEFVRLLRFAFDTLIAAWPAFSIVLVVTGVLGGLTPILEIKALSGLVDSLSSGPQEDRLVPCLPWVAALLGARVVQWAISMDTFQRYLAVALQERVRDRLERQVISKALSLRLERFDDAAYHDTRARALQAIDAAAVSQQITQAQRLLSLSLGCVAILWALAAVHLGIPLILIAGSAVLLRWQVAREREILALDHGQTPLMRRRDFWRDLLISRREAAEVRLFDLAEHALDTWRGLSDRTLLELSRARRNSTIRGLPLVAANAAIFALVALSLIVTAARGAIGAGALVALLYAVQAYLEKLHMISWRLPPAQAFVTDLRCVQTLLALTGEERQAGAAAPNIGEQGVVFAGVGFRYPGQPSCALSAIDLRLTKGERIALVGGNGAGKSTLIKLLLGLYAPTEGTITVEGIELGAIAPASWRLRVGAVMQDFVRYALSARENIGFGCLALLDDDDAIQSAARRSGADEVIARLPGSLEAILGKEQDGGIELSGGEWQKLAVARAYLRDPDLLVLDEPTSALDALAELEVYRRFLDLSRGRTVILVSHRLGAARLADRIVFLSRGQITEQGTHDELIARGGRYAELYAAQAEWYREPEAG